MVAAIGDNHLFGREYRTGGAGNLKKPQTRCGLPSYERQNKAGWVFSINAFYGNVSIYIVLFEALFHSLSGWVDCFFMMSYRKKLLP
jgi:hypothetical protein